MFTIENEFKIWEVSGMSEHKCRPIHPKLSFKWQSESRNDFDHVLLNFKLKLTKNAKVLEWAFNIKQ